MKLTILAEAEQELRLAFAYLEGQSSGLGHRFLDEVEAAFQAISERPLSFAKVETLPDDEPYRRSLLPRFRYAIVFEILDAEALIVAVPHTSQQPNYWIDRR
jgi:plasmid stabilization system protein ParE